MTKKWLDITDQKFGKLTAKYPYCLLTNHYKSCNRKLGWVCVCDCGNETLVTSQSLREGLIRSCGCLLDKSRRAAVHNRIGKGESGMNYLLSNYKARSRKKKQTFTLSREQFKFLTSSQCHYCGSPPRQKIVPNISKVKASGKEHSMYIYNGIDRVDNFKGYDIENCVPCCKICNYSKLNSTYEEFINWIEGIKKWTIKPIL